MDDLLLGLSSLKMFDGWGLEEILQYRRTIIIQGCIIVPIAAVIGLAITLLVPFSNWWLLLIIPVLAVLWWLMQLSCLPEIARCRRMGKSSDQMRREAKKKTPSIEEMFPINIPYD